MGWWEDIRDFNPVSPAGFSEKKRVINKDRRKRQASIVGVVTHFHLSGLAKTALRGKVGLGDRERRGSQRGSESGHSGFFFFFISG